MGIDIHQRNEYLVLFRENCLQDIEFIRNQISQQERLFHLECAAQPCPYASTYFTACFLWSCLACRGYPRRGKQVSHFHLHGSPVVSAMVVSSILDVSSKFWGSKKSQMRVYYCEMHGCKFNPLVCSIFGRSRCWSYIRAPVYIVCNCSPILILHQRCR